MSGSWEHMDCKVSCMLCIVSAAAGCGLVVVGMMGWELATLMGASFSINQRAC